MIFGIVAIADNYAIGLGGKLPWHYASDMKHFKETTIGNAVVMGLNTWLTLPKQLSDRLNIVLSRKADLESRPGVLLLRSREEVLTLSRYLACDIFIIGGAKTYETFTADIEQWIVTEVPDKVSDADTFMPADFLDGFEQFLTDETADGLNIKKYRRKTSK